MTPVAVGLVGAGPWARQAHAPALAAGPSTHLVGIWARRAEAAWELAAAVGAVAYRTFGELLDGCEAVAFAVPPAVQAELGVAAATAGKALLLEKPLAADLGGARRLADAVAQAAVPSQMVLTLRYASAVRAFVAQAMACHPVGGRAAWVSGGVLDGAFATPWRRDRGPVLDVGPHVIDLLEACLGRVVEVRAHGCTRGWTGLLLAHEGGAFSEASLCSTAALAAPVCRFEVFGRGCSVALDDAMVGPETWTTITEEFASTVRHGGSHPLDAQHGLRLQAIIDAAERQLAEYLQPRVDTPSGGDPDLR